MTHVETDPLALRHGALIAQIWDQINEARTTSAGNRNSDKSAFWLRRMRNLKRHALLAQRSELARGEIAQGDLSNWFAQVTDALSRAEAYFQVRVKQLHTAEKKNTVAVFPKAAQRQSAYAS